MSPSPFVMIPGSTIAAWRVGDADDGNWGKPDYAPSLSVDSLKYRRQTPPGYPTVKQ